MLLMAFSHSGVAYELVCEVDDFTDQEKCHIENIDMTTGRGIMIGHTTDMDHIAFGILDLVDEPLFEEYLRVRVDEGEIRDLAKSGNNVMSSRGYVLSSLSKREAAELSSEIIGGEVIRARLVVFDEGTKDFQFSTDGFGDVWKQFTESSPMW
jgi:hypothetical protein